MSKNRTIKAKSAPKPRLTAEESRCSVISVKASAEQKRHIKENADKADMTISTYLLARGYNYQPKSRLSEKEVALLQNLIDVRSDIRNYTNALQSMTDKQRQDMFGRYKFMLEWLQLIVPVANNISDYLNKIQVPNPLPERTGKKNVKPSNPKIP